MDSKYDQKFEEMKKYIPFLENMINRLESTSQASANPRQAQLDKIRSLRDLLLNKKKRMKMENLLKCEQVLINLYAKVEQRDTISAVKKAPDPGFSIDPPTPQEKSKLEAVRNKLKSVAKRDGEVQETLPEILRVNEVEDVHTAGSKEPALFQRRPNKSPTSPTRSLTIKKEEKVSPSSSASKRNYTRVLVSPERDSRRWSVSESSDDKPLFSRRSPRRSPRRHSPTYHKRERKKSFKEPPGRKSKDLNITLNVPEDSLSTLNTKDIFTRIINCSDGDVDIDTLRVLRKQILTELKKTGARDDISDLILKSYGKKKGKFRKKEEVEEGELSDSESEVIENLYGNLSGNLVLKDQNETKNSSDKDKARKIQICLVINSDKDNNEAQTNKVADLPNNSEALELEMYNTESKEVNNTGSNKEQDQKQIVKIDDDDDEAVPLEQNTENNVEENKNSVKETKNIVETDFKFQQLSEESKNEKPTEKAPEPIQNKANFYKPTEDSTVDEETKLEEEGKKVLSANAQNVTDTKADPKAETSGSEVSASSNKVCHIEAELQKMEKPVEIPLLNEPTIPETPTNSTVSEIDILQALKNEILSESITIPGAEATTPLLHQPKLNKVASAKEIFPKKKISIENYKQKIESSIRLYIPDTESKDDLIKKPSLKLTEKECERFNFPKMSFGDDSSGEDESEIKASDVYSDLAPTSPDRDESTTIGSVTPVIIPIDPVKAVSVANKVDVDMRALPLLSPNQNKQPTLVPTANAITPLSNESKVAPTKIDTKIDPSKSQNRLMDPRVRRDINSSQSPSPHTPDRSRSSGFTNINQSLQSPATNASMTPNARSFEMTPNHQSFDLEQSKKKHVYVPSLSMFDSRDRESSVTRDSREKVERSESRKSRFEDIGDSSWSSSDVPNARYSDTYKGQKTDRYSLDNRESFSHKRTEGHMTPVQTFGRSDGPTTSTQQFSRLDKPMTPSHPFGRTDCPTTPIHHFGRSECPPTPSHSFGRSECPPTPSHPFGRSECPPTPSHSFGRSDGPSPNHPFSTQSSFMNMECPSTPSHSFGATEVTPTPTPYYGRNECPPTPNHAFGRSDCTSAPKHSYGMLEHPKTPSHPFGRSDTPNMFGRTDYNAQKYTKDPRLNRKPEYDTHSQFDERDRRYYKDRGYYRGGSYKSQNPLSASDSYQNQDREQGRNSTYRYYPPEQSGRQLNKEPSRREPNVISPIPRDYENRRNFYKDQNKGYDDVLQRGNQRERSVGRNVYPENNREISVGHNNRHDGSFPRSSSRGPSVGRHFSTESESNTLSVKSHAGRSFTIDTSVNATFQKFLERTRESQVCEDNFDARRKRASSVGRSLVRESSCGRILSADSKRNPEINNKRELFRRASSVGRDLSDSYTEKRSFQEIKADFKTYRHPVKEFNKFDTGKIRNIDTKSKNSAENIVRSRKDYYEKYKDGKRIQKPKTFHYEDPKTPKLNKLLRNKFGEDFRQRKSGIVYSNDNIVKGAILASGYGVKNYKIPKIKRVTEEKEVIPKIDESVHKKDDKEKDKKKNTEKKRDEEELMKVKSNDKNKDKSKVALKQNEVATKSLKDSETDKNKEIKKETKKGKTKESDVKSDSETDQQQTPVDNMTKSDERVGRRTTRLSTKMTVSNTVSDGIKKTKKGRISIMSDSESDTDTKVPKTDVLDSGMTKPVTPVPFSSPIKEKKVSKQTNAIDIHTNFGLELEMFSDSVVSDPVLDNINALIADLDNDLDASKNEASDNFTKEITLENMMQNITCPQDNASTEELSKVLKINEFPNTDKELPVVSLDTSKPKETEGILEKTKITDSISKLDTTNSSDGVSLQKGEVKDAKDETMDTEKPTNVDIVSTTDTEKDKIPIDDKSKIDEQSMDGCSTPDSTINSDEVLEKSKNDEVVADSTNEEVQSETNVTSTDSEPKPSSSRTETAPSELDSLLTILQDKSLNDLLKKLTDKTDGKTRKMLEKISKIVADDEPDEKTEVEENKTEITSPAYDNSSNDNKTANEKATVSELIVNKDEEKESNKIKDIQSNTEKEIQSNKEEDAKTKKEEDTISNKEETKLNKSDDNQSKDEHQENDENQDKDESFEDFIGDDSNEEEDTSEQVSKTKVKRKMPVKKTKFAKKGKRKYTRRTTMAEKRVTRASAAVVTKQKTKKPPRELQKLHEDIKEMYDRDDILSATGIRMCRLAKMGHDKSPPKDDVILPEVGPVVVLEKFKNKVPESDKNRDQAIPEKVRKKPGPKPKPKVSTDGLPEPEKAKCKPGPKSRTKSKRESDPYDFDTESLDTTTEKASDDDSEDSSDSEIGSLASSKSFGSSEVLSEIKKKAKRKRRGGWQDGVIKPKNKKKKVEPKVDNTPEPLDTTLPTDKQMTVHTKFSFTDRNYCFSKRDSVYPCRLCHYVGADIVHHYKNEHPHIEIPLSRMAPAVAKEAIGQCKEIDFRAVSKISSDKYVCIFCYQEFPNNNSVLETFFWHVVSMHTGEYKNTCSECPNDIRCPYSSLLDIPPPPKDTIGQLTGYICKKCNFTQLSVENLKTHVIRRHNDEQTFVYNINLSAMTKKELEELSRRSELSKKPAVVTAKIREETDMVETDRASVSEVSQRKPMRKTSALAPIQSKITFETDDNAGEFSDLEGKPEEGPIKIEQIEPENTDEVFQDPPSDDISETERTTEEEQQPVQSKQQELLSSPTTALEDANRPSSDIVDYPHFKINITESGAKEYNCCINGKDGHFKTTLLISMKKHVQLKHSENWDGYCFICKVIVTPQGAHKFKDCLQHYLDKHMDNFPLMEKVILPEVTEEQVTPDENPTPKPYINVRPIYELIPTADDVTKEVPSFPIIQSVVSLGAAEPPHPSPTYPSVRQEVKSKETNFKYEEVQAQVMSNKHRVVLETMMVKDKLVKVYKCAGRFCSFTSDSAEDALLHASTHERIGGVDALNCSYCDFNAMGNAIDLVMHVFKEHGHCQYSCGQCFYRAAASQSVGAHAARVHGAATATVLRTTTVTPNAVSEGAMLTREQAVPYYVCANVESSSHTCKFRTYTPDKFCEHLQQKHNNATTYPCYICQADVSSPSELVVHMKCHGLKLYQCTWCVFGADNESELLAHVSTVHPTKQPQAYLRIITNKEGSNELRVLPLAFLNKKKVPTEDVTPSATKENPVREAERSIDLEKLIGLTMLVEPQEPSEPAGHEFTEHVDPDPIEQTPSVELAPAKPLTLQSLLLTPAKSITSAISAPQETIQLEEQTPVIPTIPPVDPPGNKSPLPRVKSEDVETHKTLPTEVVVLDSDDDEPRQPVIDLSEEDSTSSKKKSDTGLGTCPKCMQVCKSLSGLKKHMFYCYPNREEGCRCPHCPYLASNRDNILQHYVDDHGDKDPNMSQKRYQCGICHAYLASAGSVKKHLRVQHKEKEFIVKATKGKGFTNFVVSPARPEKRELPKRKLSGTETPPQRRFGPQEIHLLPINPILEQLVFCAVCEFSTKVRLNMVRHLQLHAEQLPAAHSAPVNPVPHLEAHEKHFDKMLNLAASSLGARPERRPEPAERPSVAAVPMPAELVPRYPRHISARQRNTCGALGCAYTSVDEPMLRRHWETLHSGPASYDFRCVHCPNTQITDRSKPITAARVIAHLKMHDENLYACSKCNYYHYKREALEKHLTETHPNGQLMIVRESPAAAAAAAAVQASQSAAPTMDLKPWQCGFCQFKSMLRPEVVDHCSKSHQSKMQFRCGYCPYRASVLENVNNHLAHSHAGEPEDVIYYYYREGSLPDEADGTPRWMKQRQKVVPNLPEVKTEEDPPEPAPVPPQPPVNINLNLVKKESVETDPDVVQSIEELCVRFGKFCEPNGIKFKCPLCTVITEDTREAMQSHLYEELQYRKWGCGLCNYKAFHKSGLTDHMTSEHFRQYDHIQLPIDVNKEKWVAAQLDHQQAIIDKYKSNLSKQKITIERSKPGPVLQMQPTVEAVEKYSTAQLEEAFGEFGMPMHMMFCCPKCQLTCKEEQVMRDHLEAELNKIRWGCTNCSEKYQTYHEAQFHCKGHDGPSRPKEAIREPTMRAAWVTNIILAQKKVLQATPATPTVSEPPTPEKSVPESDNSLLVVRYEERVPTPEVVPANRKRAAPESDDERLVIDEPGPRKRAAGRACPHCSYTNKYYASWKEHVLKHHNLKPFACCYCDYSSTYRQGIIIHTERTHPGQPVQVKITPIPPADSQLIAAKKRMSADEDVSKLICLYCDRSIPEYEVDTHLHENIKPDFAKKGDVVVKCCICLVLRLDVKSLQDHHNLAHPDAPMNYALFKLHYDTREIHYCGHCEDTAFKFLRDLKTHHNAVHPMLLFKYTTVPYFQGDHGEDGKKKESSPSPHKRCARKSTTKLPGGKTVAKKSTTKLPYSVPSTSEDGYSYYKTKPDSLDKYANVTTLMSFCNRMMPFTLKKLSEIINIEPKVIVRDIRADNQ